MNNIYKRIKLWLKYLALLCCALMFSFVTMAQKASVDFSQGSNNNLTTLGEIKWINSILNNNNSKYYEGTSTLQRVLLNNVPVSATSLGANVHKFRIRFEADKSGHHAYDFMTSWDLAFTEAQQMTNPSILPSGYSDPKLNTCNDFQPNDATLCSSLHNAYSALLPVSGETAHALPNDVASVPEVISSYEAHFGIRYVKIWGDKAFTAGSNNKVEFVKYEGSYIFYDVTWESTSKNVLIEFAAHIAAGSPNGGLVGYGSGQGAGNINGGPYHVTTIDYQTGETTNVGNLDNQLQGSSIFLPPPPSCPNFTISPPCEETSINLQYPLIEGALSYSWDLANNTTSATISSQSFNTATIYTGKADGSNNYFDIVVTYTTAGGSQSCTYTVNVNPNPECAITGNDGPVCPLSSNEYTAPNGMSYSWSITGNGKFSDGSTTSLLQNVIVIAGSNCNQSYTLELTVKANGCQSTCNKEVIVNDSEIPEIADIPDYELTECNAAWPAKLTTTWRDNCGVGELTSGDLESDGGVDVIVDACIQTRKYTFTVTDNCGNPATQTVTVSRHWDKTVPEITSDRESQIVCEVLPAAPIFTAIDACQGAIEGITEVKTETVGCVTTVTYIFTATDACGNSNSKTVVYTKETNVTTNCETAFGKAEAGSSCFLTEDKPYGPFNRWGWTNNISAPTTEVPTVTSVIPLYAGNSQCDAIPAKKVGEATVTYSLDHTLTVTYKLINNGNDPGNDYLMSEAHVYVGCEKYPMLGKNKYTVAPGQYTYNKTGLSKTTGLTVTFTDVQGPVWIIVHAVTCEEVCRCSSNVYVDNYDGGTLNLRLNCQSSLVASTKKDATITSGLEAKPLKVYPNPFNEKVTFEFISNKDTQAVLEITNIVGQKITTLFNGPVKAGELNRIEYSPVNVVPGVLIYQLIMDGSIQNGRVVYQK